MYKNFHVFGNLTTYISIRSVKDENCKANKIIYNCMNMKTAYHLAGMQLKQSLELNLQLWSLYQEKKKPAINDLSFHFKGPENDGTIKHKSNIKKKIIKTRAKISETEGKINREKLKI